MSNEVKPIVNNPTRLATAVATFGGSEAALAASKQVGKDIGLLPKPGEGDEPVPEIKSPAIDLSDARKKTREDQKKFGRARTVLQRRRSPSQVGIS